MDIRIFKHEQFGTVRTVNIKDEVNFVAKDVAAALGYTNPRKAVREHCKHALSVGGNETFPPDFTAFEGGILDPQIKVIPESDVYRLIMRSKLPKAEAFQDWICEEVIPSIRKHGAYLTPETVGKLFEDPDQIIKLLTQLKEERRNRAELETQIKKGKHKALLVDEIIKTHEENEGLLSFKEMELGKRLKIAEAELPEKIQLIKEADFSWLQQMRLTDAEIMDVSMYFLKNIYKKCYGQGSKCMQLRKMLPNLTLTKASNICIVAERATEEQIESIRSGGVTINAIYQQTRY